MPTKLYHDKARAELAKLSPKALQALTVRLPAGLLVKVHVWAEQKGQDLATAIRELMTLGLETANQPQVATVDRATLKKWEKAVEQALRAGRSPIEPFLEQGDPNLEPLPVILAKLDYAPIYQRLLEKRGEKEPYLDRVWQEAKADAPSHVQPLMDALDRLESRFQARRKLYFEEGPEGETGVVHWLLSDATMRLIEGSADNDPDVEAVRQLIAARYLVALNPNQPWNFEWDA